MKQEKTTSEELEALKLSLIELKSNWFTVLLSCLPIIFFIVYYVMWSKSYS